MSDKDMISVIKLAFLAAALGAFLMLTIIELIFTGGKP